MPAIASILALPSQNLSIAAIISITCNLPAPGSELVNEDARNVRPNKNLLQARSEVGMGLIMIRCPVTRREIPTGMKANQYNFNRSPVFFGHTFCPMCQRDHEWFAKDAWICELKEKHESHEAQRNAL